MTREKKGHTAGQTVIRVASCRTMGGCAHCRHADDVRGFFLPFFFLSTPTKTSACELQDKTSSVPGHFVQSSPQSPPSHASACMQPPSVPLTPPSWMGLCNVPWQLLCPVQLADEKRKKLVVFCDESHRHSARRGGGLAQILRSSVPTNCFFSYLKPLLIQIDCVPPAI